VNEYRVNLDVYNGPLDLLLYLIQREELDIYDIPIAQVTEQYIRYVEALKQLDPNLAGEFLVLAATLMEIKTRMLLPTPPSEEGAAVGLEIDPRSELVRQLLQYKAYKDAAGDLREAAAERAMMFARQPDKDPADRERTVDLEDVQIWDLVDAFSRLMEAIGRQPGAPEIIYDDTPIQLHAADILDLLHRQGEIAFHHIFEGRTSLSEIIGLFLALLELVRQKTVRAAQDRNFGQIIVSLAPAPQTEGRAGPESASVGHPESGAPAVATEAIEPPGSGEQLKAPPGEPSPNEAASGRYVSETPGGPGKPKEDNDDDRSEAEGIGA
jgi:segregation and condensation protein A